MKVDGSEILRYWSYIVRNMTVAGAIHDRRPGTPSWGGAVPGAGMLCGVDLVVGRLFSSALGISLIPEGGHWIAEAPEDRRRRLSIVRPRAGPRRPPRFNQRVEVRAHCHTRNLAVF